MCELTTSQKHIITELNNSRGEYKPAFMQIRIQDSYDGNIDELDIPTLGTIVHEYIHFLQNVSTPWGLYDSMVRYNIMAETYAFVENATSTITLPLNIDYSQGLKNKMDIVECGTGYCPGAGCRGAAAGWNRTSTCIARGRNGSGYRGKRWQARCMDKCHTQIDASNYS